MKVGFIGLGTMGASIALNAIKGQNSLVVHDINREAANPHLEIGAEWASSPKEVARTKRRCLHLPPRAKRSRSRCTRGGRADGGICDGECIF